MIIEAKGVPIHCERTGSGSQRVVLLHGWGCSLQLMQPLAQALQADMQVLCVDFPAHGESGRPPEPWGVPEFAEALREVLRQLDFAPCHVVAHSFGGRVVLWLASQDPTLFQHIVLTGAAGIPNRPTAEGQKRADRYKRLKRVVQAAEKTRLFGSLPEKAAEGLRRRYGSADYNALDEEMRKTFVRVVNQDLSPCLPAIQSPVLLLWGDRDTETPLWMGQRMEREIPDAALVVLEGGTHFAYLEQSQRFNLITHTFLTGA